MNNSRMFLMAAALSPLSKHQFCVAGHLGQYCGGCHGERPFSQTCVMGSPRLLGSWEMEHEHSLWSGKKGP